MRFLPIAHPSIMWCVWCLLFAWWCITWFDMHLSSIHCHYHDHVIVICYDISGRVITCDYVWHLQCDYDTPCNTSIVTPLQLFIYYMHFVRYRYLIGWDIVSSYVLWRMFHAWVHEEANMSVVILRSILIGFTCTINQTVQSGMCPFAYWHKSLPFRVCIDGIECTFCAIATEMCKYNQRVPVDW